MIQIIGLACGIISFFGGIYMAFVRYCETKSAAASVNWPTAQGQMTSITMSKFGFPRPAFVPLAEYTFKANGHEQKGKRIGYRLIASRDEKEIEQVVTKYPAGSKVRVTYNPADPSDSSLEPGAAGTKVFTSDVIWLLCGGIFCTGANLLLP